MTTLGLKAKIVFVSAFSGAIILGIFSRLIMATIALSINKPTNFSLLSLTEVTIVGTILGVVGGIVLLIIKQHIQPGIYRGITLGIVLYAGSLLFGMMGRRLTLSENPHTIITLVSTGGIYALYGVLNEWLLKAARLINNPNRDL